MESVSGGGFKHADSIVKHCPFVIVRVVMTSNRIALVAGLIEVVVDVVAMFLLNQLKQQLTSLKYGHDP